MTIQQILANSLEKYAQPPADILRSPANPPSPTASLRASTPAAPPAGVKPMAPLAQTPTLSLNRPSVGPLAPTNTNTLSLPRPSFSPASSVSVSGSGLPIAPRKPNPAEGPSPVSAFVSGAGQGVKNMAGAVGNFAVGAGNFIVPGVAGVLSQASPHADIREQGRDWLNQSLAGGRDAVESLGQFVGVNNAWDESGRYVGAQAPQHLAQNRQQTQAKYFSNPKDQDLLNWWRGANSAGDKALETIPAVLTGQAAVNAAARVPAVAQAGSAIKSTIEGNKYLDSGLRATSVATGMPLHPAALPGGSLTGAMGASQAAQYYAPPVLAAAAPEAAETIANTSEFLPAVAVDNVVRSAVHPDAPEYLDYWTNPAAAKATPPLKALADFTTPSNEAAQQKYYTEVVRPHIEGAYQTQGLVNQARRADNTDYAMNEAMVNDPAMKNRLLHAGVPAEEQPATIDQLVPMMRAESSQPAQPADQAIAGAGVSANAGETPAPNQAAAAGTTQNPEPLAQPNPVEQAQTTLQNAKTPEERAQAEQQIVPSVAAHVKETATPEQVANATAVVRDPASPEAQQAVQTAGSEFIKQQAGDDPSKLQNADFFGQAMGMWDNMGPMGQAAFMLGVPAALIGLLSGDGLMGILGGLGIGVLGMGAGAMGMMGENTQRSMGQLMGTLGSAMGFNTERDANNLLPGSPAAKKFETDVAAAFAKSPAEAQKLVDARVAQFQPLEQMHSINPELAHAYLMGMENGPATSADAAKLYQQLAGQVAEARDPSFLRNKAVAHATDQIRQTQNLAPAWLRVGARMGKDLIPGAKNLLPSSLQQIIDAGSTDPRVLAEQEIEKRYKESAAMNIATKLAYQYNTLKAAQSWAGVTPHARKPQEKQARQPYSGPYSSVPFDPQHTAETLGMPSSTKPQMAYNRAMHLWRNKQLTPAQSSALQARYGGLPPMFTTPKPAAPAPQPQPTVTAPALKKPTTPAALPRNNTTVNTTPPSMLPQSIGTKLARCWAGYEPVPGKKPYSNDSCRPVGSKKKKKQTGKERHHEATKQGSAQG